MIKRLLLLLILVQLSIAIFAEGGNSSTDATPIPGLPFSGSGNLIDNTDNNNERYRDEWWVLYTPHTITNLDIHPIYNGWDGYLFVYDSSLNLIASNDDGPDGYLDSQVILDLSPGETIYICIDEYSAISENPSYVLNVTTDNMWPPLPPGPVTNAFPQDGAIDVPVNTTISWEFGYYTDSYDLYLGTTYPPTSLVDSGNFTGIVGDVGFFETNNLLYNTTYYWRIELHNASHVDTATCDFSFTTMIYNDLITIGDGMEVNQHLPIEPYYGYSYSQSIYVQSEINLSNHQIWSVSYHFNNGGTLDNCNDITIYMGHTNMSSFDSNDSWIPYDQLTEVYDGPMPTIHADGWIEFELDDPFTYNNISNLVIAIKESEVAYASSNDDFYCTPCSENRSICYYNDSTNPDPMNPPTANDFVAYRPNIKLEMSMMPGAPFVMPGLIDFSAVSVGSVSPAELVTMQNVMAVDWEIQSVSINSSDFTLLDGNNYPVTLSPAERVYAGVQFNPTSSGHKYATLTITDNHNPEPITLPIHGYGYVPDNNDSSTDATELSLLGYDVEGYQEIIESQEDVDWYVFWSYENVELDIHTENAEGSDVDLAAQLYGPYENTGMSVGDSLLIAQSDNDWTDGVNPHIVYNINPDGMGFYYLRIAKSDNPPDSIDNTRWDTNDYTLWIYSDNTPPNPDCPSPHDLEYMITYQGVELEWDYFLSDTRNLEGYNVYRDSVLINPEPIPFKRCFDQGPFVHGQIYDYAVTAVFSAPMDESSPSDTISVAYVMVDPPEIAENFENYDDFSTSIPYWTMFDLDGEDTSGFVNGLDFPGEHSPMSYIVFNPNSTVPPLLEATAYSGEKYLACFSAQDGVNDDWLISPMMQVNELGMNLSFKSRSFTDQFGLDQLEIGLSNGSTNPDDFTLISGDTPLDLPVYWDYYEYPLNDYYDQLIRIGFHCVSEQTFFMMLDDIEVSGVITEDYNQYTIPHTTKLLNNYPNPFNPETTISFDLKERRDVVIDIYNIRGQKINRIVDGSYNAGTHSVLWNGDDNKGDKVSSGVYFYKLKAGTYTKSKKMILMK